MRLAAVPLFLHKKIIKKTPKFYAVTLASLLLAGCNSVNNFTGAISGLGTDNAPPPASLVAFQPQFSPRLVWQTSAGNGNADFAKLRPSYQNGRIFTADTSNNVIATNASTGKRLWAKHQRSTITSGPSVADGLAILGTADGKVIALNENDGSLIWQTSASDQILAAPVITQDRVLIKTIDGKLTAYSLQNGQQLWVYNHGSPTMMLRDSSNPQIHDDKIITGFSDGKLAAINLNTGSLLWEQLMSTPQGVSDVSQMIDIDADPVIRGNTAYVAVYQGNISAVDINTGNILWQKNISSYNGLAVGPHFVFATDRDGNVWAFNRNTGDLAWQQTQLVHRNLSSPTIVNNMLVIGDGTGYVHWLAQNDGHFIARNLTQKNAPITATPLAIDNTLYIGTAKGNLSAWQVG